MLIDTHCHLFKEYFNNLDEVIINAKNNNVCKYISDADNIASCYEMLDTASKYEDIYITLGIHPENVYDDINVLDRIVYDNLNNKKFVAIGEIGLDYYYSKENKEEQIKLFEHQLELAEKINKPVVVHSREATLDTITSLKKYNVKGVIHCFSGSLETAKEYIKMGFLIGVGGVMTFKNAKIGEVIKELPLESLVLETDSPYLAPTPHRGETNEPKYIKDIAEYLANLKNISFDEVMKKTTENALKVFDI